MIAPLKLHLLSPQTLLSLSKMHLPMPPNPDSIFFKSSIGLLGFAFEKFKV